MSSKSVSIETLMLPKCLRADRRVEGERGFAGPWNEDADGVQEGPWGYARVAKGYVGDGKASWVYRVSVRS